MICKLDGILPGKAKMSFFIDGKIPAGSYSVVFTGLEDDAYLSEPLIVSFDDLVYVDDPPIPGILADVTLLVGDVSYSGQVFCGYIEPDNITAFVALPDSEISVLFDTAESARFTLIPPMEFVMDGFSSLLFWIDSVWQLIQDNALLASFAASGLVILCVPIFIQLKKASH